MTLERKPFLKAGDHSWQVRQELHDICRLTKHFRDLFPTWDSTACQWFLAVCETGEVLFRVMDGANGFEFEPVRQPKRKEKRP